MSDTLKRPHEVVRTAIELFRSHLSPLTPEHRAEVLAALGIESEAKLVAMTRDRDEWKAHNEQRMENVYKARMLLNAQPDETLPAAVERVMLIGSKIWAAVIERVIGSPWFPDDLPITGQKRVKEAIEASLIALRDRT